MVSGHGGRRAADGGVQLVSIRAISLRDITIASHGRQVTVSAESSLVGTTSDVAAIYGDVRQNRPRGVRGSSQLEPAVDANLTITANRLDVDELLALASAFAPSAPAPWPACDDNEHPNQRSRRRPHVTAKITAASARAGDLEVQDFAATIDSKGQRVSLTPLTFRLFGGKYDGAISATLGKTIAATIRSRITDLDVAAAGGLWRRREYSQRSTLWQRHVHRTGRPIWNPRWPQARGNGSGGDDEGGDSAAESHSDRGAVLRPTRAGCGHWEQQLRSHRSALLAGEPASCRADTSRCSRRTSI